MNDPNIGFIVAAYALGFIVIAGMIGAVLYDRMALQRALAKLQHSGEAEG